MSYIATVFDMSYVATVSILREQISSLILTDEVDDLSRFFLQSRAIGNRDLAGKGLGQQCTNLRMSSIL